MYLTYVCQHVYFLDPPSPSEVGTVLAKLPYSREGIIFCKVASLGARQNWG